MFVSIFSLRLIRRLYSSLGLAQVHATFFICPWFDGTLNQGIMHGESLICAVLLLIAANPICYSIDLTLAHYQPNSEGTSS
jgi:hypothetical protein